MRHRRLEEAAGEELLRLGWTLALAESCTGGLIGFRVTSVAGSSRYLRGGVVAYDNAVKAGILGVPEETLRRHGAVSAETAVAMARGTRKTLGAKVGLSVTGIAGPGGGSPEKPVGLVYAAVSSGRRSRFREGRFRGSRDRVRRRAAEMALDLLVDFLRDDE